MSINQPRWKEPEYTITQVNKAGVIYNSVNVTDEEKAQALKIIDNWRAAHAYPLHVFYMNLRQKTAHREDILVAERLKRLDSIINKLQRQEGMKLARMQDLGGCRMILPKLEEVYRYSNSLKESRIRHELKKEYDYIARPKISGYRSLHLVYRFKTDTKGKDIFNQYPMYIEVQFRTHLQHLWATAVETIGLFTNQALKAGQGEESIKRFFLVVSALFAIKEDCPVPPETVDNEGLLIEEIKAINKKEHILDMLRAIRAVIDHEGDNVPDKKGYYILRLDYNNRMLKKLFFKPSETEKANKTYELLEKKREKEEDIVLVRASSFTSVRAAYPNYFLDIGEFVTLVEEYINT